MALSVWPRHQFSFTYQHPHLPFRTDVHHHGEWTARDDRVLIDVTLAPQCTRLSIQVVPLSPAGDITSESAFDRDEEAVTRWRGRFARVEVPGTGCSSRS